MIRGPADGDAYGRFVCMTGCWVVGRNIDLSVEDSGRAVWGATASCNRSHFSPLSEFLFLLPLSPKGRVRAAPYLKE